jgi:hypothetical protein
VILVLYKYTSYQHDNSIHKFAILYSTLDSVLVRIVIVVGVDPDTDHFVPPSLPPFHYVSHSLSRLSYPPTAAVHTHSHQSVYSYTH